MSRKRQIASMRGEFVDIGGARLYYYAAGTRGAGEPVVFLHGFPTSSRLWHSVIRDFPAGHRMVVCDLPGFGRSDPPAGFGTEPATDEAPRAAAGDLPRDPRRSLSCGAHAEAVLALLDDLRVTRACIVGHGLGGGVAQIVASRSPERVSRLALLGSPAFDSRPRRLARLARRLGPMARLLTPSLLAGLVQGSVIRGFAAPERSRLTLDTCLQRFTSRRGRDLLASHLAALDRCDTVKSTGDLASLRIPIALIWGADDPFYPVEIGARLKSLLPSASLDIIPGASHFVPEDSPQRVIERISELLAR